MRRLVSHPRIGPDVVAEPLVGAVSTWSNDTDWPDAAASFVGAARRLRDVGVIDEDALAVVEETIEASGMLDCERIIDLATTGAMRVTLLNYGLGGEYERVPAACNSCTPSRQASIAFGSVCRTSPARRQAPV